MVAKLQVDKIAKLVESIKSFAQTDLVSSEANTKKRTVEPLLELLGWDLLSNEVQLEYPIQVGTSSGHADYAISRALIESGRLEQPFFI